MKRISRTRKEAGCTHLAGSLLRSIHVGGGGLEPKIIVRIVKDAEQCRVD